MKPRTLDLFASRRGGLRFFMGTHEPLWLERLDVPLFVARPRFQRCRRRRPRALAPWAMDSGGFTEVTARRGWSMSAADFVDEVEDIAAAVGNLLWAAPQDWMCEAVATSATGLSIEEHQRRTVDNFLDVRDRARGVHFVPVLQGFAVDDYLRCVDLYAAAGVDLAAESVVGLGTVCRRQATEEARAIVFALRARMPSIRLHGFGFKMQGLDELGGEFDSADSMAWSYNGRRNGPLPTCTHPGRCANCLTWAMDWRRRLAERVPLEG